MENKTKEKISLGSKLKIVFATLLTVSILILIIQNWKETEVNFIFKTISTPLPIVIVISLFTGYIWGTISAFRKQNKKNKQEFENNISNSNF